MIKYRLRRKKMSFPNASIGNPKQLVLMPRGLPRGMSLFLAILICVLIAGCGKNVPDSEKSKQPYPQVTDHELLAPVNEPQKQDYTEELLSSQKYGRDNPFNPIFNKIDSSKQTTLIIEGIVWDKERPMIIINNEIIGIGDNVDGNTVVEIKDNSVILNDGVKDFELRVGE